MTFCSFHAQTADALAPAITGQRMLNRVLKRVPAPTDNGRQLAGSAD